MTRTIDDSAVLDLLADPLPETVPDVVARLDALEALAEQGPRGALDGLACFTCLYGVITREVLERLQAGAFADAGFLARLDVEFARLFFSAVRTDAAGERASRSWQVLLDRRCDDDIDPMRFAVAGVNAHVNLDLAFAVIRTYEVLGREFSPAERDDYDAINDVFAEHMSELRRHFESRFAQLLDREVFDDLADDAGDLTVLIARDAAWRRAEHLWPLRGTTEFDAERDAVDWRTSMIGRAILGFGVLGR